MQSTLNTTQATRTRPRLEDLKKLKEIDIKGPIVLSNQEVVENPNLMVSSHLAGLEAISGKSEDIKRRVGMPLYDRLVLVYKHLNL